MTHTAHRTTRPAATPAELYLASLSEGSQGMRQSLDIIAGILDERHDADSFPWQSVTYRESMAVRIALIERYKPSTVNKMLSALRGVLKQTWRLGLIDADAYRRAADVENIRVSDLLSGRTLAGGGLTRPLSSTSHRRPAGRHFSSTPPTRASGIPHPS